PGWLPSLVLTYGFGGRNRLLNRGADSPSPWIPVARLQINFFAHLFADGLLDKNFQGIARFGMDEGVLNYIPIQLVTLAIGAHPYLAHGCVGADYEFRGRIFELHAERAGIEIHFESVIVGSCNQFAV